MKHPRPETFKAADRKAQPGRCSNLTSFVDQDQRRARQLTAAGGRSPAAAAACTPARQTAPGTSQTRFGSWSAQASSRPRQATCPRRRVSGRGTHACLACNALLLAAPGVWTRVLRVLLPELAARASATSGACSALHQSSGTDWQRAAPRRAAPRRSPGRQRVRPCIAGQHRRNVLLRDVRPEEQPEQQDAGGGRRQHDRPRQPRGWQVLLHSDAHISTP